MTQLQLARQNIITPEMKRVAKDEDLDPEFIRSRIAEGKIIIPANHKRKATKLCGIGAGLKTKVNANIGTSGDYADIGKEIEKLRAAEEAGADAVMDLSTGGDLRAIRKKIIDTASIAVGSVPIYEAAVKTVQQKRSIVDMTAGDMLEAIKLHCEDG
ncbi:MAG: phosphomethylpyrimidine synthase ThiC, partial [Planctomycetota bacterium]